MSEAVIPRQAEPRKLIQSVIDEKIPAVISYLSQGKWRAIKIRMTHLGATRIEAQLILNGDNHKTQTLSIESGQPVGVSLKYRYGKVVFDSTVVSFEQPKGNGSGQIWITVPDHIKIIERRSYFRVNVPQLLKVNVILWHRQGNLKSPTPPRKYWQGRLVDISAGGLQVMIDNSLKPDFHKGQFVTVRFTPLPYEQPLMFNAQIRNILPTADQRGICMGMQIVGLEASPEGREVLQRLCHIVEQYFQINRSGVQLHDFQPA